MRLIVLSVVIFLTSYGLLGVAIMLFARESPWFDLYKSLVSVVVAVPWAYLAYAFQQRVGYVNAVRDLFKQIGSAVQAAIHYTHSTNPTRMEYRDVQTELSMAIDSLRGVFKNIHVTKTPGGLYPYENLKDILDIIKYLGCDDSFGKQFSAKRARERIIELWREMQQAMLLENDREEPVRPVSRYLENRRSPVDDLRAEALAEQCPVLSEEQKTQPSQ